MPLRRLFWVLSALTIAFLVLQVLGFGVLEVIVALLLVNIAVVELSRQEDKHLMEEQMKPEIITRIGNVEKLCSNMLSSIGALPTLEHMYHVAEEMMIGHKAKIKDEIKEDIDRLARKAVDIENRLFEMKKTVASGIGGIDDRLRAMETGKWTITGLDEDEEKPEQPASEYIIYGENVID
jgi:hypothetical protein